MPLSQLSTLVFAAVLFDLDGTLVDSTASVERVWTRWAAERGIPRERLAGQHGVPTRQILRTVLPAAEVAVEQARIEALEVQDADGIVPLPGAVRALAAVGGTRSAIVTSCTGPLAVARIEAARLPAPDLLITADEVARGKPHPDPYLLAAARLGVRPADCLVVEDAPAGLASARAAGCRTLALRTTHTGSQLTADAVVGTLAVVRFRSSAEGLSVRIARVPG